MSFHTALSGLLAVAVIAGACSNGSTAPAGVALSATADSLGARVQANGALTLYAKDFPAVDGSVYPPTLIAPENGGLVVTRTQAGSLCQFELRGAATVTPGKVVVDIAFLERFTSCTADLRSLRYTAAVVAPSGTYDVVVVHHRNARADTVAQQSVVVP
jgi:hypothetical protein